MAHSYRRDPPCEDVTLWALPPPLYDIELFKHMQVKRTPFLVNKNPIHGDNDTTTSKLTGIHHTLYWFSLIVSGKARHG